jgi:hypothetical protein
MSNSELKPLQEMCLAALRDVARRRDVRFQERERFEYSDGVGVAVDVGWVPLEVAPDQVDICTPYNQRYFEFRDFESEEDLLSALVSRTEELLADPVIGRHPLVRLATYVRRALDGSRGPEGSHPSDNKR